MRSLVFRDWPSYPIVFLLPNLKQDDIRKEYLDKFGIPADDVKVYPLHFTGKKTPVGEMKQFVEEELVPTLKADEGTKYLIVADAGYYKVLTGQEATKNLGYVQPCLFGPWNVLYVPTTKAIFYDPEKTRAKIAQGMNAFLAHVQGNYQVPGHGIIHFEAYPREVNEIAAWLEKLLEMNCPLAIDIEAFALKHYKSGIGTITFCWSKHEGISFPVDYVPLDTPQEDSEGKVIYGTQQPNEEVRRLLKSFFCRYLNKHLYHNISFDVYVLIYQLFMKDVLDSEGLLEGMKIMLRNWDDTQTITYLATNSCAGNKLKLKENTQEFSGNYAVEVEDIRAVPLDKLLRYNLIDGLSTMYLHEKNYPRMVEDQQLDIYNNLFKPTTLDIIQMQLTGLPLNMKQVQWVKLVLASIEADALKRLHATKVVQQFTYRLREQHVAERNTKLKKKKITLSDPETLAVEFNPNSGPQKQDLLFNMLGLPVLDLTDTKQPATGGDVLEKLINHTQDQDVKDFLQAMLDYVAVNKLLKDFIPAFEEAVQGPDGWHYLIGFFRLGGTKSGRLSSNNPNLQNLPANIEMVIADVFLQMFPGLARFVKKGKLDLGKLMKSCFEAPPGWIFVGLDFASLEDRISALTTKDPNKIKVYTDGYDGHSLRAFAYFKDQMEGIEDTVDSINSIQFKFKGLRQDSKAPTFALTYQGTYLTLVRNCGFTEIQARQIEARYHELYKVSDAWVQGKLDQAAKDGYITAAFGLRIRTPLLAQVIRGTSKTPFEAEAEGRTAGNALGQSWCLLTNRASVEFMTKVRTGPHALDIKPCAHIHDAQYYMVRDNAETVLYVNEHLVKAVQWQEHPEIQHDKVKLGGNLSLFWPDWSSEIEIPNNADETVLHTAIRSKLEKN